jgi:solute carrier family 24 (sodium/potassium/calcium exchanger), member 6
MYLVILHALTLLMAVGWIQLIAQELVGCLQAFGMLMACPSALLGFSLAIVNSFGDKATNIAVAKVSGTRAAFAACFSGMAFNLALAPAYGWFMYHSAGGRRVVPVEASAATWLLWGALAVYLISVLLVLASTSLSTGQALLPASFAHVARGAFLLVVSVVVVTSVWP